MKKAVVKIHEVRAGVFTEKNRTSYIFQYDEGYSGSPISLTMSVQTKAYEFDHFPPFFDGLLPEGIQLQGLLKINKIDKYDYFKQLLATGGDLVGAVTISNLDE